MAATKRKATPAQRARARRDPAIFKPPPRIRGNRTSSLQHLHLRARGRTYPIGGLVEGDTPWSMGMDQTGQVTLPLRDPSHWLPRVLDDEAMLMQEGVRVTIDAVTYCVMGLDHDGEGLYTLTLEDEVSWTLKLFSRFRSASRKRVTRFGFIYSFITEASRKPLPKMRAFIPEVDDPLVIRKPALEREDAPAKRSGDTVDEGTGAGEYKVKGKRATARQRGVLDGALGQAKEDGASRRVMMGVVMALTQESRCGEDTKTTGNDDTGLLQQGRNWISVEGAKDPAKATHAFLVTGPTSWKKVHGGLKHAPGDLESAIKKVQGSVGGYDQWEDEAKRTVDAWLDDGGNSEGSSYIKRYTYTRGEKGGARENSWDAAARLTSEVGAYRWAAGNVFYAASGNELRRGKPSVMIRGDEGWLRKLPAWSVSGGRAVSEVTLEALSDRWDVMPGGVVQLHRDLGTVSGKWMVWNVSGSSLDNPEVTVVLRRPTRLKTEPPSETAQHDEGDGESGTAEALKAACKDISDSRHEYVYGGSHGPPVKSLKPSSPFDCSSSVSYALYKAGFFDGDKPAYVSGTFASSWGSAGKGDEFTVYANGEHVWIEFEDGSRFDTSQHSGKSGPMYTTVKRSDQGRFTPRHRSGH